MSVQVRVMQYPPGYKDANDLFTRAENAGAIWERMIRDAKPSATWLIDGLSGKHDLSTAGGKCDAAADMLTMLLRMTPIERAHHTAELSIKLGIEERALRDHLNGLWRQMEPEHVPERRNRAVTLDRHGEARGFECPTCHSESTHYSQLLKEWHCFECETFAGAEDVAALQRLIDSATERPASVPEQRSASLEVP